MWQLFDSICWEQWKCWPVITLSFVRRCVQWQSLGILRRWPARNTLRTPTSPLVPANITTPIIPPGDANYNFYATYTDSTGLGIFFGGASASDLVSDFSVESCLDACFSGGTSVYQYAGVENGVWVWLYLNDRVKILMSVSTCYCGNGWNPGSEIQVSQSEANVQCIGNAYELCGGVSVIQIYTVSGVTIPILAATSTARS
jgi:hypothetical protein